MKLTCYAVALVVLFAGSAQMVGAHLNASAPLFCPDMVGCIPVPDVQWASALADHEAMARIQVGPC
jgi:hypothetical protein